MSERAELLHRSPWRGVFFVTGGGVGLLDELLATPGASATVLDAQIPYGTAALAELLGRVPEQACSEATARALAMAAFQRARGLGGAPGDTAQLFGAACTASLATNRPKRGRHRVHVAVQTAAATYSAELGLSGTRPEEESHCIELLWHAMTETLGLGTVQRLPGPPAVVHTRAPQAWRNLILGDSSAHATAAHDGKLLVPGAFNPLHQGHRRMLEIAGRRTGLSGAFELSVVNVDKPAMDYTEIAHRLEQFDDPVWVTRLPTFLEKARRFPGAWFAVGADTLARIVEPAYYGGPAARDRALAELLALETRFLVFGRSLGHGFVGLTELSLPDGLREQCLEVPRSEFDEAVSSSELRRGR